MARLVLHPTDISQWQALLYEAQSGCGVILSENTESYLVFLLMRQVQNHRLLDSVLATELLESLHLPSSRCIHKLREVGDKSLLFCGLFPAITEKKHLHAHYYRDLGRSAYLSAADMEVGSQRPLFYELGHQFEQLQHVLLSVSSISKHNEGRA